MSTTLVATGGKGSNPKTTLYVGGLDESVNESILHAAFIPFGDIKVRVHKNPVRLANGEAGTETEDV